MCADLQMARRVRGIFRNETIGEEPNEGIFCLLFVLLFPYELVAAHSGNTDSYGGHNKRANGTYHCHSGQCLEDARQKAYDRYFPLGQKDGLDRFDDTTGLAGYLRGKLDSDQAEYMIPFAIEAYKAGYKDTYVPTFWGKYGWYLGWGIVLIGGLSVFGVYKIWERRVVN